MGDVFVSDFFLSDERWGGWKRPRAVRRHGAAFAVRNPIHRRRSDLYLFCCERGCRREGGNVSREIAEGRGDFPSREDFRFIRLESVIHRICNVKEDYTRRKREIGD